MINDFIIAGAGGAQGLACAGYLRGAVPTARIIGIDRAFSADATSALAEFDIETRSIDMVEEPKVLRAALAHAPVCINLAGPFYRLGTVVLDAAIDSRASYVDICDDVDATEALLARDEAARAAGICAVIGMGSAPGTTNLLVKLALAHLPQSEEEAVADIAWCAPGETLTFGIFQHLVHCFRTVFPGRTRVPEWEELEPKLVEFPNPIGPLEVVRLGHPEPLTIPRFLGCATSLRGGMTGDGLLRTSWELARACDDGLEIAEAWQRLQASLPRGTGEPSWSGMSIDVTAGGQGLRFESATTISMEQSTAVPATAAALLIRTGEQTAPGVWAPEALEPSRFFEAAGRVSPGGGGLRCYRIDHGQLRDRVPLRTLFQTDTM